MITVIDKNKEKHNGRLQIENVDVLDIEIEINWIIEALEDYNFDKAKQIAQGLSETIESYQKDYEIEVQR